MRADPTHLPLRPSGEVHLAHASTGLPVNALPLLKTGQELMRAMQDCRSQWVGLLTGLLEGSLGKSGQGRPEVDTLDTESIGWCARINRGSDLRATKFVVHSWRLRSDSFSLAHPLSAIWEAEAEPVVRGKPTGHRCTLVGYVFPRSIEGHPDRDTARQQMLNG